MARTIRKHRESRPRTFRKRVRTRNKVSRRIKTKTKRQQPRKNKRTRKRSKKRNIRRFPKMWGGSSIAQQIETIRTQLQDVKIDKFVIRKYMKRGYNGTFSKGTGTLTIKDGGKTLIEIQQEDIYDLQVQGDLVCVRFSPRFVRSTKGGGILQIPPQDVGATVVEKQKILAEYIRRVQPGNKSWDEERKQLCKQLEIRTPSDGTIQHSIDKHDGLIYYTEWGKEKHQYNPLAAGLAGARNVVRGAANTIPNINVPLISDTNHCNYMGPGTFVFLRLFRGAYLKLTEISTTTEQKKKLKYHEEINRKLDELIINLYLEIIEVLGKETRVKLSKIVADFYPLHQTDVAWFGINRGWDDLAPGNNEDFVSILKRITLPPDKNTELAFKLIELFHDDKSVATCISQISRGESPESERGKTSNPVSQQRDNPTRSARDGVYALVERVTHAIHIASQRVQDLDGLSADYDTFKEHQYYLRYMNIKLNADWVLSHMYDEHGHPDMTKFGNMYIFLCTSELMNDPNYTYPKDYADGCATIHDLLYAYVMRFSCHTITHADNQAMVELMDFQTVLDELVESGGFAQDWSQKVTLNTVMKFKQLALKDKDAFASVSCQEALMDAINILHCIVFRADSRVIRDLEDLRILYLKSIEKLDYDTLFSTVHNKSAKDLTKPVTGNRCMFVGSPDLETASSFALSESGEFSNVEPNAGKAPMSPFGIETKLCLPNEILEKSSRQCITWDEFSTYASEDEQRYNYRGYNNSTIVYNTIPGQPQQPLTNWQNICSQVMPSSLE